MSDMGETAVLQNLLTVATFMGTLVLGMVFPAAGQTATYQVQSPDQRLQLIVDCAQEIELSVQHEGQALLHPSVISMQIQDGPALGKQAVVKSAQRRSVDRVIEPLVKEKQAAIRDHFAELRLTFEQDYALCLRAYNNGVAYRWETKLADPVIIEDEQAVLHLAGQDRVHFTKDTRFQSDYEKPYVQKPIAAMSEDDFAGLPFLIETAQGPKLLLAESDLRDYPGLWLRGGDSNALQAVFPRRPQALNENGSVQSRQDHLARTEGTRTFPWRIVAVASKDEDLLLNQLVYQLAEPLQIDDPSWIEPGQVILDWWGRRNIFGVDFEAGVNTATMKYFIDFCAEFGVDYFLLDEGWSTRDDVLAIHPDVDLEEVIAYSEEQGVQLMLWVHWNGLRQQLEAALDQFEAWGIAGIKVDFMNRDDQDMVNFYRRVAQAAAQREMVIVFHGSYKPAGLRRAYPNVLTREGLIEFEYNGWTDLANPQHHMTFPFIRMACGPVDYIPGTLNNAQKKNFCPVGDRPMGLGTRAHSFALAVILDSPIRMLPDSPSDYWLEEACTRFLTGIPVEWHETVILNAQRGEFIALARRHHDNWYVAAATNWQARDTVVDFSFLGEGRYQGVIMQDGPNADRRARDYQMVEKAITRQDVMPVHLAPGGGWLAKISKVQ